MLTPFTPPRDLAEQQQHSVTFDANRVRVEPSLGGDAPSTRSAVEHGRRPDAAFGEPKVRPHNALLGIAESARRSL